MATRISHQYVRRTNAAECAAQPKRQTRRHRDTSRHDGKTWIRARRDHVEGVTRIPRQTGVVIGLDHFHSGGSSPSGDEPRCSLSGFQQRWCNASPKPCRRSDRGVPVLARRGMHASRVLPPAAWEKQAKQVFVSAARARETVGHAAAHSDRTRQAQCGPRKTWELAIALAGSSIGSLAALTLPASGCQEHSPFDRGIS